MKGISGKLKIAGIVVVVIVIISVISGGGKKNDKADTSSESATSQSTTQTQQTSEIQTEELKKQTEEAKQKISDATKEGAKAVSSAIEVVEDAAIDPAFKEAMDNYEAFFDEYVNYMKRCEEEPTNAELLSGLSDLLARESKMIKEFDEWSDKDMNTAEAAYYLKVQSRIYAKLAEVS